MDTAKIIAFGLALSFLAILVVGGGYFMISAIDDNNTTTSSTESTITGIQPSTDDSYTYIETRNFTSIALYITSGEYPALVFKEGGSYHLALRVEYYQGQCGRNNSLLPHGTIVLDIERAENHSNVGNFKEEFWSRERRKWKVPAEIKIRVNVRPKETYIIKSNFENCILQNKMILNVTRDVAPATRYIT
ncbi:uncharacterized protein LOC110442912 [Mizuhopecten yessoensis]|uniref:Uncharacterized protein n=1 Tax=Mizuhopecten yessoensis TaxID=6573 RepID=A0A210R154_MIZYE|nr:uncharacterized protein LOC110442912 [Mizuhopecten yessoensis]OWF54595.1 hypothetical protein KP79_PYT20278 [Mizuhopecten yessoensis]